MIRTRPPDGVDGPTEYPVEVLEPVEELDEGAWLLGLHHSSRFPLLVRPLRVEGPYPNNLSRVGTWPSARMHSLLGGRFPRFLSVLSYLSLYRRRLP